MLFAGANIADGKSQSDFVIQLRVRKQCFAGRIYAMHDRFIQNV